MPIPRQPHGLTLVEAMLLLVIVSIVAVAAGVGLQAVVKVPAKTDGTMAINSALVSIMEQTQANLLKTWPGANFDGANYQFTVGGSTRTPANTVIGTYNASTGARTGSPFAASSVSINNKSYQFTVYLDRADPAMGTSYQTDFLCLCVQAAPAGGSFTQSMMSYVTKP
jgi:Tfp pilus assembly major pilin PilA